ncbi:large conductance mechanosensitive channel protein MscL [Alkalihalophilus marmarensis]|uniref:large conductance mechanosensitive channel protein MscL n=1 Tax=Alkalihalophilus marmarensis TaxID=521377 RepID=UPI002DBDBE4C|nr:large conductance mechanosensitive channel protein MscL [Alkalihalophilus marmarensis]MEC2073792.1 large conductance mechanosensitive channel protein MscL [Alkalihalophilus marmarensis]
MNILQEFKEFAVRGNVIDMSVGVIIGTTFAKIVESFVEDVIMPPFSVLFGQVDFSNLYLNLSDRRFNSFAEAEAAGIPMLKYGMFLNHIVHFAIVAFILFLFVRQMNRIRRPDEDPLIDMKTKLCSYCFKSIAYKARRCPHCTSNLIQRSNMENAENLNISNPTHTLPLKTVIKKRSKS